MTTRNRNKEIRKVRVGDLRSNPTNHRIHPDQQKAAMLAIFGEVGFCGTLVGFEMSDGTVRVLDGNLRISTLDPDDEVEVAIFDGTPEERRKLQVAFDAVGDMGEVDADKLAAVLAGANFESPDILRMFDDISEKLAQMSAAAELSESDDDCGMLNEADQPPPFQEPPGRFQVVVTCMNEAQQTEVMELLKAEGLNCRKLTT